MTETQDLILGEATRSLDDRYRVSIPTDLVESLAAVGGRLMLAKERQGCLSLWSLQRWQSKLDDGVELVKSKIRGGRLEGRIEQVQLLGRLLSTRHQEVQIAGRGRVLIPEGFRDFLGVEPGGEVYVVGAAVCVEIWNPARWLTYLEERMPEFRQLFDQLTG